VAKRDEQPEWNFGAQGEESNSSTPGRWIDAPATPDEDGSEVAPRRPEGFDGDESRTDVHSVEKSTTVSSETAKPRRKPGSLRKPLAAVTAFLLVAALGFFGLMGFNNFQDKQEAKRVEQQVQQQEREKAEAIEEAVNPFAVLVGEVDPPSEDPLDVTVAENKISVGDSSLSVRDGSLTPTVNGCSLVAITDICLGARGKLGEGDFDVLLIKDISRTRMLDNPTEFTELKDLQGVSAAAIAIDMGSAEGPERFGAITANGTTGFVLIFPKGTSADKVEEVLRASTVI